MKLGNGIDTAAENPTSISSSFSKGSFSSPIQNDGNTAASSSTQRSPTFGSESSKETPPLRVTSLRELYESCNLALIASDPITYNEAAKK